MSSAHWKLDTAHSEIHFRIRHMLISTITGSFNVFSGSLVSDGHGDFKNAYFTIAIDVYSIDTNNPDRDEHLKSSDFFDADAFPNITFRSQDFTHIDGDDYKLAGILTVKEISKDVVFNVKFGGLAKDGFGQTRADFEINGEINRNDFGIHSSDVIESGGLVIGEAIKLHANLQFIKEG